MIFCFLGVFLSEANGEWLRLKDFLDCFKFQYFNRVE